MTPSINPAVPAVYNQEQFDGSQPPPQEEVVKSVEDDAEVPQLFSLAKSAVIVTGGARGLGLTMASAVIEAGGDAFCCDILESPSQPEWKVLEAKAKRIGAKVQYHRLNIIDVKGVAACFDEIASQSRYPITGFIAGAATMDEQMAIDYDMDTFSRVMRINIDGTMATAQAAAKLMRQNGQGGSIVIIASISGQIANRGLYCSAYNASKAACHQLCRSLAVEWGQYKIRVNTISPGYIRTAMTNLLLQSKPEILARWEDDNPLQRIAWPNELKGPAIYLLSQASSFVTGSDIRVDGGHCAW